MIFGATFAAFQCKVFLQKIGITGNREANLRINGWIGFAGGKEHQKRFQSTLNYYFCTNLITLGFCSVYEKNIFILFMCRRYVALGTNCFGTVH